MYISNDTVFLGITSMNFLKIIVIGALLGASSVHAALIDNGAPDAQSGVTIANAKTGADDFVLSRLENTLLGGSFWTLESDPTSWDGTLEIRFYDDAGGNPGNGTPTPVQTVMLHSADISRTQTAAGISLGLFTGLVEYRNVFTFTTPVDLIGGHYWMALYMQGDLNNNNPEIFWETTGSQHYFAAAQSSRAVPPLAWNNVYHPSGPTDLAFTLSFDIPEPVPAVLMLAGVAAMMAGRRKKAA